MASVFLLVNAMQFNLGIIKEIYKHSDDYYTADLTEGRLLSACKRANGKIRCFCIEPYDTGRGLGCYDEVENDQPEGWFEVLKTEYEKRNKK